MPAHLRRSSRRKPAPPIRSSCCRPELRDRSRAGSCDGGARRLRQRERDRAWCREEFPWPVLPALRERRCDRRRDRRRAEKHHRDCRRCRRGSGLGHNALAALITRGPSPELTRPRVRGRRAARDALRSERARRSRAHVHGKPEPESPRRPRVGAWPRPARHSRGDEDGRRGRDHTGVALELGAKYSVELPIATQMAEVLNGRCDVRSAISALIAAAAAGRGGDRIRSADGVFRADQRGPGAHDEADRRSVRRDRQPGRRPREALAPSNVDTLDALEELLISADIGVAATDRILTAVKSQPRMAPAPRRRCRPRSAALRARRAYRRRPAASVLGASARLTISSNRSTICFVVRARPSFDPPEKPHRPILSGLRLGPLRPQHSSALIALRNVASAVEHFGHLRRNRELGRCTVAPSSRADAPVRDHARRPSSSPRRMSEQGRGHAPTSKADVAIPAQVSRAT